LSLITLDEARALLFSGLPALGSERVLLDDALGRTLAEPVIASHTQPSEPRATMDGIAVPDLEPSAGASWTMVDEVRAGGTGRASLRTGECVRIATGAVLPEGAVRVIPQELIDFSDDRASLAAPAGEACFIRPAGADFAAGARLLEPGTKLAPGAVGLVASANCASIEVVREPRVAVCTTGDELIVPGSALGAGQSVDSASHALAALVRLWGCKSHIHPILPDDLEATASALGELLPQCEILLCIGGASVGKRDLMRPAAASLGARFLFEGIAVQPGKPCWHARTDASGLILGLPGNPSSAFVCAHLLLQPLVDRLMERTPTVTMRLARSACALPPNGEREQYLRARASYDAEGGLKACALPDQDSGLQAALAHAQLLIRRLPRAGALAAGELVEVLELSSI